MTVRIDGFPIDAVLTEDYVFDSEMTAHTVEEGADVTDHIKPNPIVITLQGIVSDTPIGGIEFERDPNSVPTSEAYLRMLDIRRKREPVTIETSRGIFKNMGLRNLSVPQTPKDSLEFRATFQQIQLVRTDRTFVTVDIPKAKKKVNRGHKPSPQTPGDGDKAPAPSKTTDENASVLYKGTQFIKGLVD